MPQKQRGVFERPPGSGTWWISYFGSDGKRHREKIGRQSAAVDAYFEKLVTRRSGPGRGHRRSRPWSASRPEKWTAWGTWYYKWHQRQARSQA